MAKKKGNTKKQPQTGKKGGSRTTDEFDMGGPQPVRKKKK